MAMLLKMSTAKLQDELRDTIRNYTEEKQHLQTQLANLRLDLNDLHRDDKTVTTDETASHISFSNTSEPELKRLEEIRDDHRSLQLPAIKNINLTPGRKSDDTASNTNKALRFNTSINSPSHETAHNNTNFLNDYSWNMETKEKQKFLEMQRNQEVLRNIGRANHREKRASLIRLPTISSAKKRTTVWDSGKNVSRPKGQSTLFETFPYVEASVALNKRNFKIPKIKDPQRSEIQMQDFKRLDKNKKKVQFTRPSLEPVVAMKEPYNAHDTSVMGGESLNTTLADTSVGDTTLGHITFDEYQIKALVQRGLGDTTVDTASVKHDGTSSYNNLDSKNTSFSNKTDTDVNGKRYTQPVVPPLKLEALAKSNVLLHDLNNLRLPLDQALPRITHSISDKSSDRSFGTKISRLSQETQEWKTKYMSMPDPDVRKKTLSDIMFAVRSRMRDNEATLRFGETPRPSDPFYADLTLEKETSRWNKTSPRKKKQGSKQGQRGLPAINTARATRRNDSNVNLQSYLRKVYKQRKTIDRMAGEGHRLANFAGHKELQMVAQQA